MKHCGVVSCMRTVFVFSFAAAMLLSGAAMAQDTQIQTMANLTQHVCADKLVAWGHGATSTSIIDSLALGINRSAHFAGLFMRGKWKADASAGPVVLPPFLTGKASKFDFYSPHLRDMVEPVKGTENILKAVSGHLYFWNNKKRNTGAGTIGTGTTLDVAGVFNSGTSEVCMAGCANSARKFAASWKGNRTANSTRIRPELNPFAQTFIIGDCTSRILLKLSPITNGRHRTASGTLESLKNASSAGYFSSIHVDGAMVSNADQQYLYRMDLYSRAAIFAVDAVLVAWQVVHSFINPASYFVSMQMILVQIAAMVFLSGYLIYVPWRLLTINRFKFLFSSVSVIPWVILMVVVFFNILFLLVILRKRWVVKRLNVVDRPHEMLLAAVCLTIYAAAATVLWSSHTFETYVEVVWCWFLLPQVIANVVWDLRMKPLHWVYIVGVSLCRIAYIGFNGIRPTIYGYDDLNDFPHGWFWGITGTVVFFAAYELVQQRYGGRYGLPQKLFGYQAISTSSNVEAGQDQSFSKEEDRMLDL